MCKAWALNKKLRWRPRAHCCNNALIGWSGSWESNEPDTGEGSSLQQEAQARAQGTPPVRRQRPGVYPPTTAETSTDLPALQAVRAPHSTLAPRHNQPASDTRLSYGALGGARRLHTAGSPPLSQATCLHNDFQN